MRIPDWLASVQRCTSERVSKDGAAGAKHALSALCLIAAGALPAVAQAAMNPAERAALVDLYNNNGGPTWSFQGTWLAGDPCDNSWYGILCTADRTSVRGIFLPGHNLTGSLSSLESFPNLEQVYVSGNQLTGSIPAFGPNSKLLGFVAENNQLSGTIPPLTGFPDLQAFNVAGNQLTGSIPVLTGQTAWNTFNVANNQLTGPLPELTGPGLASLRIFSAEYNQLRGAIPSFADAVELVSFRVGYNRLSGSIPVAPSNPSFATYFEPNSAVCPNFLSPSTGSANDLVWDSATRSTPWSADCTAPPSPAPVNDSASTAQGEPVTIDLRANDSAASPATGLTDPSIVQQPANGTVTINGSGLAVYTPHAGFTGTDSFSYEVCQEEPIRTCATAQVTVVVNAVVSPPGPRAATPVPAVGGLGALLLTGLVAGAAGLVRRKKRGEGASAAADRSRS